jgi:hypothetical protein
LGIQKFEVAEIVFAPMGVKPQIRSEGSLAARRLAMAANRKLDDDFS